MSELVPGLSAWVVRSARAALTRHGWSIQLETDAAKCPQSLSDLRRSMLWDGRWSTWTGGSQNTIFWSPRVNWMMRALHDVWHLEAKAEFDLLGEARVHEHAKKFWPSKYYAALEADGIGQSIYHAMTTRFPDNQRAFVEHVLACDKTMPLEEKVRSAIWVGL